MAKPRLIVGCPVKDIEEFRTLAKTAARASKAFDVRVEVSQLARKKSFELTDPGDSYLDYSVKQPGLSDFAMAGELKPFSHADFVKENASLMDARCKVLRELGLGAAFLGHEPLYYRQPIYEAHPHWRGPRVDHPRRSRNPIWAPCLMQDEVQDLYRRMTAKMVKRNPELDTFGFLSNDCGTGFCWHVGLYCGPNGPESCRSLGEGPHAGAFQRALIEGAAEAGAEARVYLWHMGDEENRQRVRRHLPEGGHVMPADEPGGGANVGSVLAGGYPVACIQDPFRFLEDLEGAWTAERDALFMRFGRSLREPTDPLDSVSFTFDIVEAYLARPTSTTAERIALLTKLAVDRVGAKAAPLLVEAWLKVRDAFRIQRLWTWGIKLLFYGVVSTRWLTRPLVAFPEELGEDEDYFLPHIFNVGGKEVRRNILDVHGGRRAEAIDHNCDYGMRIDYYRSVDVSLERAAQAMDEADEAGARPASLTARALRVLRCVFRNCRHTLDFGLLLDRARPRTDEGITSEFIPKGDEDGDRVHQLVRAEIDNTAEILRLIGDNSERLIITVDKPEDEDTFLLGPDLPNQLRKRMHLMIERWDDFRRLYAPPNI